MPRASVVFGLLLACETGGGGVDLEGSTVGGGDTSSTGTTSGSVSSGSDGTSGGDESTGDDSTTTTGSWPDELPGGLVVDVEWLSMYLGHPNLQVVDARQTPGAEHIPGAIPLDPIALATTVDGIDAQIMPPAGAEPVLQTAGLRNGTTVVVYGNPPEYDPARVVWALHYYAHGDVRYLDGGFDAWVDAGGVTEPGPALGELSDYSVGGPDDALRVTGDWVLEQLGDPPYDAAAIDLVDARSTAEWDKGRIPTAVHVEWLRTLSGGELLPTEELEALYADVDPGQPVVTYCLVGWRASVSWLTLRWLGYEDVRVYDGSWVEWSGDASFPIETD